MLYNSQFHHLEMVHCGRWSVNCLLFCGILYLLNASSKPVILLLPYDVPTSNNQTSKRKYIFLSKKRMISKTKLNKLTVHACTGKHFAYLLKRNRLQILKRAKQDYWYNLLT